MPVSLYNDTSQPLHNSNVTSQLRVISLINQYIIVMSLPSSQPFCNSNVVNYYIKITWLVIHCVAVFLLPDVIQIFRTFYCLF